MASPKFTPQQILEIRSRYAAGESQGDLCREYEVTINTIGRIVRGETYQAEIPVELTGNDLADMNKILGQLRAKRR